MWRIYYLMHLMKDKKGIGVVEVILIYCHAYRTRDHIQVPAHKPGTDYL